LSWEIQVARKDSREELRKGGSVMWRMALGIVDGSQKMEAEVYRKGVAGSDFQRGKGSALTVMTLND
jgi:hypothetical protein